MLLVNGAFKNSVTSIFINYSQLSFNGHLYKTDASLKGTPRVGTCCSSITSFDSRQGGHLSKMDT